MEKILAAYLSSARSKGYVWHVVTDDVSKL